MTERARFIEHKGRKIYLMDCSDASLEEMNEVIEACERDVRSQPEKSVYTLIVAGGSSFSGETINRLKELARGNTPYVIASSIVGITGLYKVVLNAVAMFSKRRFYLYDTVEEAKDFLADYTE
ncbi:MAG: hypothetical protein GWO08_16125 [Gammaproteobacteria bacterium]|nr:hypothetical protein [Gammaproteobacteria bacterium]NIR95124.1 hypothetical protein [Gammaproteobacteria bacterium]